MRERCSPDIYWLELIPLRLHHRPAALHFSIWNPRKNPRQKADLPSPQPDTMIAAFFYMAKTCRCPLRN